MKATAHFLKNPKTKPVLHAVERLCRTTARSLIMPVSIHPNRNKSWTLYHITAETVVTEQNNVDNLPVLSKQTYTLNLMAIPFFVSLQCPPAVLFSEPWVPSEVAEKWTEKKKNLLLWLNRVLLWMPQGFLREEPWNGDKRSAKWWRERK